MFSKVLILASVAVSAALGQWKRTDYQLDIDNSTYANAYQIHTTHFHLDWEIDFTTEKIDGSVTHDLEVLEDCDFVYFDNWILDVKSVQLLPPGSAEAMRDAGMEGSNNKVGEALTWSIDVVNPIIGDAMTVNFPTKQKAGTTVSVQIFYTTRTEAQAFSWMQPSQTAGGVLPYMYTQCEDINCRTVAPLQDTPANRVTYSAVVVTQNDLTPYMSANTTGRGVYNATHNVASFSN